MVRRARVRLNHRRTAIDLSGRSLSYRPCQSRLATLRVRRCSSDWRVGGRISKPLNKTWPRGAADAIGQTGEFLVWASVIAQSGGRLHVFLPLLDRGIDGLIHRLDDGAYLAVQVKAKTVVGHGEAPIAIYADHLFTPDQLVVGVFLDGSRLGPYALVVDSATLTRKATRIEDRGRAMLIVDMPAVPTPGHKWSEDLIPSEQLAARLGATEQGFFEPPPAMPHSDEDRVTGFIGEQEVCRRLATIDGCGLFRPFPDSEMVEIIARDLMTGATVGIQVKTAELDDPHAVRHVLINRATFVADPSILVVVLAWIIGERRFHETCLVLPATDIPSLASTDGPYYELHFRADGSRESSRLDPYRMPLSQLPSEITRRLEVGRKEFPC